MQVGTLCPSWAAALELHGVHLIFAAETSKTQETFNEVTILAQNSPFPPKKQIGECINERRPQRGVAKKENCFKTSPDHVTGRCGFCVC